LPITWHIPVLLSIEVQNVTIYGGIDGTVKLGFLKALYYFFFWK
jgi:hypothetical protein